MHAINLYTPGAAQKSSGTFASSLRLSGLLLIIGGLFFCFIPMVESLQRKKRQRAFGADGDKKDEVVDTANLRPGRTMSLATVELAVQKDSNLNWTQLIDLRESDI